MRRQIAQPLGPGSGPAPPLQYSNLPAHLAQQLAALPQLQPLNGRSRGHGHGQPAPAPVSQYAHLPLHLQQQLALLPSIPAPATHGYNSVLSTAASIVCIIYQFDEILCLTFVIS